MDVSQAELAIAVAGTPGLTTLANEPQAIRAWLKTLPAPAQLAVEATNIFPLPLIEAAHPLGHTVYVVDGYRLSRYRDSVGERAKTDRCDAQLLARYLVHEHDALRAWTAPHRRAMSAYSVCCTGGPPWYEPEWP